MKVLDAAEVAEPAVSVILTSHMKPILREALDAMLAQTWLDRLHVVVADSNRWDGEDDDRSKEMRRIFDAYAGHPHIDWCTTEEGPDLAATTCPVAWAGNEVIRAGLLRGRYVCTAYDDDRWHPTFVERMAGYLDAHAEARAVWCSQNRIWVEPDGTERLFGMIVAAGPKQGASMDCQVDGGQVMWRRDVLDDIGDPWIPEERSSCYHSDGLFLNKLGAVCGVVPNIPDVLCDNRRTPYSTFTPSC